MYQDNSFLQFSKGPAYGKLNIIIQKIFLDTKSVIKSEGGLLF